MNNISESEMHQKFKSLEEIKWFQGFLIILPILDSFHTKKSLLIN